MTAVDYTHSAGQTLSSPTSACVSAEPSPLGPLQEGYGDAQATPKVTRFELHPVVGSDTSWWIRTEDGEGVALVHGETPREARARAVAIAAAFDALDLLEQVESYLFRDVDVNENGMPNGASVLLREVEEFRWQINRAVRG